MLARNVIREFQNQYNKWKKRKNNIRFLPGSYIDGRCVFEGYNSIGANTRLYGCDLGIGTYVGRNVELTSVKIGRFSSIGSFLRNTGGRHPVRDFVSTHPAFFSKGKAAGFTFSVDQKFQELKYVNQRNLVNIGNDVWIGDNVTILDGVNIGDGAVIGANSLVMKDVTPYTINVGLPAKSMNMRFDEETVRFLLDFKWWEKDFSWIQSNYEAFADIEKFKGKFKCN